jgi:hypothetical protein
MIIELSAAFGISFVLDVCEYIPTYSQACPWLFTWPGQDFYEEYHDVRAEPRIAATLDRSYPGQPFLWKWSPIII